ATLLPELMSLVEILSQPGFQTTRKEFADRTNARLGITGSALQALVGLWLADTYRKHFQREPAISRNQSDGAVTGPYVRFALQVTKELNVKCAAETIDAALSQHGKTR